MEQIIRNMANEFEVSTGLEPNTIIMGKSQFDKVPLDLIDISDDNFDKVMGMILFRVDDDVLFIGAFDGYLGDVN